MKRSLISLLCCTTLLLSPTLVQSIELVKAKPASSLSSGLYGPINGNETLWGISEKLKPNNSVSIYQTLIAIYKLNPNAFEEGNVNKIIENNILKVPKIDFIQQQTTKEARELIKKKRIRTVEQKESTPTSSNTDQASNEALKAPKITPVIDSEAVEKNNVDKADLKLETHIHSLKTELVDVKNKLIGNHEKNQILKIKLQGLTDQIENLKVQLSSEVDHQQKAHTLNQEYQKKLENIKQAPFSGKGMVNETLRFITSSIEYLLAFLFLPLILLSVIFVFILRRKNRRQLEVKPQGLVGQTSFNLLPLTEQNEDAITLTENDDFINLDGNEEKITDEALDFSKLDERDALDIPIIQPTSESSNNAEEAFIDIETLLESSDVELTEETEFDLELDLDEIANEIHSEDLNESKNKISMKLDLARGYLEIDDKSRAKKILDALLSKSEGKQKNEIEKLLNKLK